MLQTQLSRVLRERLTATILAAKAKRNLTFEDLTEHTDLSIAFVTAALLGQHALPANAAKAVGKHLDLDADDVALLQTIPLR
jgi:cyanate lyase